MTSLLFRDQCVLTAADYKTLPSGRVAIPVSFYRILARVEGERVGLLSLILPQDAASTAEGKKFTKFLVLVDEVKKATGVDFMPGLMNQVENAIKAARTTDIWPRQ